MNSEITIRYSDKLIRSAARQFLIRYVRRDFVLATVAAFFSIGLWLLFEVDWKMPFGLLLLALALILIVFTSGFRYTQLSLTKFRSLKDPTSLWRFTPEYISAKTELGSSEFRWEVVTEIWRYPEFWLLHFGHAGYSVLPVAALSEELQSFIVAELRRHGGKIS